MTTRTRMVNYVEIKANVGATSGAPFLDRAIRELNVYGGSSSSVAVIDDDGRVSISFDPDTADGGPAGVLKWLDEMGVEYDATFSRWRK